MAVITRKGQILLLWKCQIKFMYHFFDENCPLHNVNTLIILLTSRIRPDIISFPIISQSFQIIFR